MTIALASRGYLRHFVRVVIEYDPGPEIVGLQEPTVGIDGSLAIEEDGPTIVGSVVPGPDISASSGAADVEDEAPSISGSDTPELG
jgi:hypothetical protein